MTEEHRKDESLGQRGGIGRRGLLAKLGATGLAATIAVFADRTPARASTGAIPGVASGAMCCDLRNFPANSTYAYCHQHADYIWYCSLNKYLSCSCCETEGQEYSAAECRTTVGSPT